MGYNMKYKNMTLAVLLLLAILTMGAVSASEDVDNLTVSDDAGEIEVQAPVDDEILTDSSTSVLEDGGDDELYVVDYMVEVMEEFDISDRDQEIIRLYCPEGTEGYFVIVTLDDDWRELYEFSHEISENDWGTVIGVTPDDLDINEPGGYIIDIYLTDDPESYHEDDLIFEAWRGIEAIDYTQFRYISLDTFEPSALFMDNIFAVYCPDGSSGTVTVDVRKEDDDEFFKTSQKYVRDKEENNMLYWTLSDLDIYGHDGKYTISVYHMGFNGSAFDDLGSDEINAVSPISIEQSSYIDSTIHGGLVFAEIPSNFEDGEILFMIDGNQIFTISLNDFAAMDGNSPYWRYAELPEIDEGYKWYYINNYHFNYDFDDGNEYVITAILTINSQSGELIFNREEEVRMIERNVVTFGDYSIEIFGDNGYDLEQWTKIIVITAPEDSEGTVRIEVDENEWSWEGSLDELSGFTEEENQYWIVPEFFNDLGSGDYEIIVSYLEDGEAIVQNQAFITFFGDEDEEDGPIEDIELEFNAEDEEELEFEISDSEIIAYLLIPDNEEFEGTEVTVTITKNGEDFATFNTEEMEYEIDDGKEAKKYPIALDLTQFNDKDLLSISLDCFDEDWLYVIEIAEDTAIFHMYEEGGVDFYVFIGNITLEDFNNPERMGPHPRGNFIEFSIPESYDVTEGSIVVSDDSHVIYQKALNAFVDPQFDYSNLGYRYIVPLNEYNLMGLPENMIITFTLNFASDSLTLKRIRHADYLSQIVTPDDVARVYDVTINEEVMTREDDTAVSIVGLDANPQTIWIELGEGQFNVYVNDEKVEGLGNLIFENWMNNNGVLDADLEELYDMDLPDMEISLEEFAELSRDEKISILKEEFPDDITLFRLTNFRHGCPELQISLADLNITESGEYNIKVTHFPGDPIEVWNPDYPPENSTELVETLVLERNVTVAYPIVSVSAEDISVGEDAVIIANMVSGINGNVHFTVNGVTGKASIVNGVATYTVSGLKAGSYEASARFNGNKRYGPQTLTTKFNVVKSSPFISVSPVTVKYGVDAIFTVNLASDVPGNVRFALNGNAGEKAKITNGVATYTYSGLKYGLYNVDISYAGNYKYAADTISTTLKVNKNSPIVSVVANDILYNENATITVNLAQNVPGNVHFTIGSVTQKGKITDGVATATFTGLKRGTYDVTVYYAGNVNYVAQTKTASFNIIKGTPFISVDASDVVYGEDAVITVNLASDVPGNVKFTINGVGGKGPISNGVASYTFSGLRSGTYEVIMTYAGNVNYNAQTINATFNVVKGTPITSVSVDDINVGDSAMVTVNFLNGINGFVKITVNGVTERVQISNGMASASFSNLKAGTYEVSAFYAGNTNFNNQTATANFTVSKTSPGLTVVKRTVDGKTVLIASIAEDAPGNVNFAVNGGTYKAKIVNGEATLTLPDFAPGTYTLKSSYGGNYKYLAETKTRTITIK